MIDGKRIIAIITARGGSKGLPGKNIKMLQGKPLLAWTIEQAKASHYIDDIFVSTDSLEIAEISEHYGVTVPELRPARLATDTTSSADVVSYVLSRYAAKNQSFDFILLLEPTSPMRKETDIDKAIELLSQNESADGVVSIGEVHMEHPMIVKKISETNKLVSYITETQKIFQRQQADKAYFPYGVVYLVRTSVFNEKHSFYTDNILPYYIERWQCYELDDIYDFYCIDSIFKHYLEDEL